MSLDYLNPIDVTEDEYLYNESNIKYDSNDNDFPPIYVTIS